ncbi:MAG: glycosyltransferase [Syntrophorhabdaceae bacterium]|nr:glycosyltransferase [Syntrophorhabdaceae bacterium]
MELELTRRGNYSLRVVCPDGSERVFHSLYDPEGEAEALVDASGFSGSGMLVVLGLGLGYHVDRMRRLYPDAEIVVIESSRKIFDLCLEHGKGAQPSEKVHFLVDLAPEEAISEVSRIHLKAGFLPLSVFSFAPGIAFAPGYYDPIRAALEKSISFRLWERVRYPKLAPGNLTIALFDFGYFLTEEIARALAALGHSVVRVRGKKDEKCGDILGRVTETIALKRPDFFLTVNHLGFDEEGVLADFFESIGMPAAVWYVDNPNLLMRIFPQNVSPCCCVFTWDESYKESLRGIGFENVEYLPLAADEEIFHPMRLSIERRNRLGADVGFVGDSRASWARELLQKVRQELHPAVKRVAQRLSVARNLAFHEAKEAEMRDSEHALFEALTEREKSDFEAAVFWRGTLLYRLSCLRTLEEFCPLVRGDAEWGKLLNDKFRFGPRINYYKELPAFYNLCRINLNTTSIQMDTAVNQRVFDVPACGAFLLTDRRPSLSPLFEEGKEVIVYDSPEEIPELVRFYLRNNTAREAVAAKGKARVLREHTYKHRVDAIIRRLRDDL